MVLSPFEYTGALARLITRVSVGATPLTSQYSGRHISSWNEEMVYTELFAEGVTGKIQVGVAPGGSATVIVPTCGVPLGGGTVPNAPEMDPVLVLLLAQEARTMAPATTNTASFAA